MFNFNMLGKSWAGVWSRQVQSMLFPTGLGRIGKQCFMSKCQIDAPGLRQKIQKVGSKITNKVAAPKSANWILGRKARAHQDLNLKPTD